MAVSGRKVSDFSGSVSKGSAEDFDHSCEPCLVVGQHIEAHGFCVECQQYLCQSCITYHESITATKNHQLLDKDNMSKQITPTKYKTMCNETCTIHTNEIIKFYCKNHEFLGCSDCIMLEHRTCKIEYIPDHCANIGDSDEYRDTLKEIDQKIKEIEAIVNIAKKQDNEIDMSCDHLTEDIAKFRKEINDHLDILQKNFEKKAEEQKYKNKDTIANVLQTSTSMSSDLRSLKIRLQNSKTALEDGKTYTLIKQAQSKLKRKDVMIAEESLQQVNIQYQFERNNQLDKVLIKQDTFGRLNLSKTMQTPRQTICPDDLTKIGTINVKTKSDKKDCKITGSAVLSSNKVVVADWKNSKLKVVDIERELVSEEKKLDAKPWDIAVLPQDQIAVTEPDKREILILTTAEKLSITRSIPVSKGHCKGITYHQDHLYVVCETPNSVLIADTKGSVKNIINLDNAILRYPSYIVLSEDFEHIYVSNYYGSNSVVDVTLQGDISAVYKINYSAGPVGMLMLDDGSLLVCFRSNGTIHHISGDLKHLYTILDGFVFLHSICYNHHKQEIYVVGQLNDLMIIK